MTADRRPLPIRLMVLAAFVSACALRVCDPLVPQLAAEFGRTPGAVGQVIVGFGVAYGLMQLMFGPLGDRYGKPWVMMLSLYGCALAAGISALGHSFTGLLIGRILWGVTAAGVIPLAMAWIGDRVRYEDRQTTLAKFLTGTLSGMFAGQLAGGLFADSPWGWRGAFATLAVGYLVAATFLLRYLRRSDERGAGTRGTGHIAGIGQVLGTPWARVVLLAVAAEGLLLIGALAYIPTYLHQRFGLSLSLCAALTAVHALGGLAYTLSARYIVPRLGERGMSSWGGVCMGAGFLLWWLMPWWGLAAPAAFIVGFGTYLFHNTLQTHATQMTPHVRGTSVALFAFSLFGSQAAGAAIFGRLFDQVGMVPLLLIPAALLPLAGWSFSWALARRARRHAAAGTA